MYRPLPIFTKQTHWFYFIVVRQYCNQMANGEGEKGTRMRILTEVSTIIIPEVRADCSKNVSMTGKCFPVIHFHYNVCQLSFIVHCFELLKNTASMEGVHGIAGCV